MAGKWYVAETPARMCPKHRTWDLTAIQAAMAAANKYEVILWNAFIYHCRTISISVMDYLPVTLYEHPNVYFAGIDDAIRSAAFLYVLHAMIHYGI